MYFKRRKCSNNSKTQDKFHSQTLKPRMTHSLFQTQAKHLLSQVTFWAVAHLSTFLLDWYFGVTEVAGGGWRWSGSDLPQMSLISGRATSQDLHTDALQLKEPADRLWLSLIGCMWTSSMPLTHVHPATSALNPQLPPTPRISPVTFDLLTSWKLSNALSIAPQSSGVNSISWSWRLGWSESPGWRLCDSDKGYSL